MLGTIPLKKTPLYDRHVALSAKMVPFAGWEMPVSYKGIVAEHQAVRNDSGIFDVSHMGRIVLSGKDAPLILDYLSTNNIIGKQNGQATYTVWCNEKGGAIDDLLVYQERADDFFVVANASNREKDYHHLLQFAKGAMVDAVYEREGILAVQGPKAIERAAQVFPEVRQLKPMRFFKTHYREVPLYLAGTGYTGAGGFEIYAPQKILVELWDRLVAEGIEPTGLGARDTLRLEMGYALYGHELKDNLPASQSVAAWAVKMDKGDFIGKSALQLEEERGRKYFPAGICMLEPGVPREGYRIKQGEEIGFITSGTFSPSLNKGIALVLANKPLQAEEKLTVEIRGKECLAETTLLPFWRKK